MQVAALDDDDKVVAEAGAVGRNLGNRVEIESGLSPSDRLIDNPLESIADRRQGEYRQSGPERGCARESPTGQIAKPLRTPRLGPSPARQTAAMC